MYYLVTLPGGERPAEVLAEDVQSEGGDVPGRAGGDPRRDRAHSVPEDHGPAVQGHRQMCLQPTLPGERCFVYRPVPYLP